MAGGGFGGAFGNGGEANMGAPQNFLHPFAWASRSPRGPSPTLLKVSSTQQTLYIDGCRERLTTSDALSYLRDVKTKFSNNRKVYDR